MDKKRSVTSAVQPPSYSDFVAYYPEHEWSSIDHRDAPLAREHQTITTTGHPWRLLGRQNQGNIGGPFSSHKIEIDIGGWDTGGENHLDTYGGAVFLERWSGSDHTWDYYIHGKIVPAYVSQLLRQNPTAQEIRAMCPTSISDVDLDAYGATAISLCAPRSPLADASSTIGELKDGLPHFPNPTGNIGGEYLNVVFGIQPILSELKDYHSSWINQEKLLDQLEKDSGKWIRRGFKFNPKIESSMGSPQQGFMTLHGQVPVSYLVDGSSRYTVRTVTKTNIWFSGAFTYHLPKSGWRRRLEEIDYLYGLKPGVDTAWELMPWSWLVDWYSNVGDVLHNVNAFAADGLVMPYGYIMCTQEKIEYIDYYLWVINSAADGYEMLEGSVAIKYTTKQRRPANPFGFGLSFDALSGRQLAILAALGISRA